MARSTRPSGSLSAPSPAPRPERRATVDDALPPTSVGKRSEAVRQPLRSGAKTTATAQVAPAATVVFEQLSAVTAKRSASSPSRVTAPTASGPLPLLRSVKICGAEVVPALSTPKSCCAGASAAAGWVPVAESVTGAGPKPATATVAALTPGVVGAKATVIEQLASCASTAAEQLSATFANWLAPLPASVTAPSVKAALSRLVSVTVRSTGAPPTRTAPKASVAADASRSRPAPLIAALVSVGPPSVAICSVVVRAPAPVAVGEKATATVQLSLSASGLAAPRAEQLSAVIANWPASAPVTLTEVTASGSLPVLLTVYVRALPGPAASWRAPAS